MLSRLRIAPRILVAFLAIAFLGAVIAATGIWNAARMNGRARLQRALR